MSEADPRTNHHHQSPLRTLTSYGPSLIVFFTAVVVLLAGPRVVRDLTYAKQETEIRQASHRLSDNNVLELMNQAFRDIATVVEPSVVHISAQTFYTDRRGQRHPSLSSGSGWIYDDQGHVITNYHVIRDASHIQVQLYNGVIRKADVVGSDQFTDIAVVKIDPGGLFAAVRAPVEQEVEQGDLVFAFGSPFDFRFSMSSGVVSGKGRSVGVIRSPVGQGMGYENFIQVDAAINPGNSGGPLTDFRGAVIGMNTAIATQRNNPFEEGQFAGIGLAIPLAMIEPVVSQLIETGTVSKGYLGIRADDLVDERNPDLSRIKDLERLGFVGQGVQVFDVPADGPARDAGIEIGDVITAINGHPIRSMAGLRSRISSIEPGESIDVTIWRYDHEQQKGIERTLPVVLSQLNVLRSTGFVPENQSEEELPELGIRRMTTATEDLAREFDVRFRPGVMVLEAEPDSTFAEFVPPGSIIVAVSDFPVTSTSSFLTTLRKYDLLNRSVRVTIQIPDGDLINQRLRVE